MNLGKLNDAVCKVIYVVDMFYKDIISANDVYMLLQRYYLCLCCYVLFAR